MNHLCQFHLIVNVIIAQVYQLQQAFPFALLILSIDETLVSLLYGFFTARRFERALQLCLGP